jgi:hypothetical protein
MALPYRTFDQAPFAQMVDSLDPTTADPLTAVLLQNCYPQPGPPGVAVVGRPGFTQLGLQLGAGANRRVQGFHQYTKTNGTEFTVAFVGGRMYTLDWPPRTWTEVTLVGVSLSTTARVRCVTFADVMVVSDGVNRPWTWDGTTFVDLTNAPVFYGPPTVYYGKLFGIKNADRRTLVWSEENLPNTGYEAGGFNNAWGLIQTSTSALERLLGTNEALYYWRARSTGRITGAVTPDFVNAGTREGVSDSVGTLSPDSVVIYDDVIYFVSADGQPFRLPTAGSLQPQWEALRETYLAWPKNQLAKAWSVAYAPIVGVLHGIVDVGQTELTQYAAVSHRLPHVMGLWSGWTSTAIGLVRDQNQNAVLLHGTANGYVYDHGNPDGTYWTDANNAADGGTVAIAHGVVGSALGYSVQREKRWDRLDLTFRALTDLTAVTVDYETPRGLSTTPQQIALTGTNSVWDLSQWDVDLWSTEALERKKTIGLSGYGRWIRPRIRHQFGVERFALVAVSAAGFIQPAAAEAA